MAEGIDRLEFSFNEAANAVQAYATGQQKSDGPKPTDAQLLELYGLYKVATVGPCDEPQPGILQMKARAKWSAWKNKSEMSKGQAMSEYVNQVKSMYNWTPPSVQQQSGGDHSASQRSATSGFGPAVSRPHVSDEEDLEDIDTPFGWIKDNEIDKIRRWVLEEKPDVNVLDDNGLTLLHWAVDRHRTEICDILLRAGANPEIKDEEDQTPLDYAITCEHDDIVDLLEEHLKMCQITTGTQTESN